MRIYSATNPLTEYDRRKVPRHLQHTLNAKAGLLEIQSLVAFVSTRMYYFGFCALFFRPLLMPEVESWFKKLHKWGLVVVNSGEKI